MLPVGGVAVARTQDAAFGGVLGDAVAQEAGEEVQGGSEGAHESGVGGEVAADLVRVGVELDDREAGWERGARGVVVRGEGVCARDQDGVVRGEGLADGVVAWGEHSGVQGVCGGEVQAVGHRLVVHGGAACLGDADEGGQGALAADSVAGDDDRAGGGGQEVGGAVEAGGGAL